MANTSTDQQVTVYPKLAVLRKLEKDTLRRITEISEFGRLPGLQTAANLASTGISDVKGPVDVNLGFTLDIRLRGDRNRQPFPRRLDIGALIEPSEDGKLVRNASYSLLICRYADAEKSPIVRKVHFDYEPVAFRNPAEPKPTVHLQICGKFSRHHLTAGYKEVRLRGLYPSWEKPRFPLPPTTLALILNWLLLEFQSDPASQAILKNPTWRNWVAYVERAVLLPYFEMATRFLQSAEHMKRRFLQSHLYGMGMD